MAKKGKKIGLYEIEWATVSIRAIQITVFLLSGIILGSLYWLFIRSRPAEFTNAAPILESAARFIDYEGKVEVKPKEEFEWKAASFKMDLHEGDRIRTSPASSAKIKFEDGTEITVQTDSIVIISRRSVSTEEEQPPLMMVETGQSDVNAEKSANAPSVSSSKISRFKLAPGSTGSMRADSETGQHVSIIDKGYGVVTDVSGRNTPLRNLEELTIGRNNELTKTKLPPTPPLISPQMGQLFEFLSDQGLTVELKWRDLPDIARFHVQISESPLFGKLAAESAALTKSAITIRIPKSYKKQYFWRVRSIDAQNHESPWSDPYQFVVETPNVSRPGESLDRTPPALKINYMHPFLPFVQVEGITEPDAFLTLNGQIIDVKEDGSFVYTYTLETSGWNNLNFVAEDPSGNKTTITKRVEYK